MLNSNAPFIYTSREKLVGRYIGGTEENTLKAVNEAIGGVLFIDEAYSLTQDDSQKDFGYRVIDVLTNQMEIHKNDICFIFAGYHTEMLNFLKSNPGLESRIPFKLEFKDYSAIELYEILKKFLKSDNLKLSSNCKQTIIQYFDETKQQQNFGNGRFVRNFFERLKIKQANRVAIEINENINLIKLVDVNNTIKSIKTIKENRIGFL